MEQDFALSFFGVRHSSLSVSRMLVELVYLEFSTYSLYSGMRYGYVNVFLIKALP